MSAPIVLALVMFAAVLLTVLACKTLGRGSW